MRRCFLGRRRGPGVLGGSFHSHRSSRGIGLGRFWKTRLVSLQNDGINVRDETWTSWWFFTNPSEKYAHRQIGFIFPNFRDENSKNVWNHHLVKRLRWFIAFDSVSGLKVCQDQLTIFHFFWDDKHRWRIFKKSSRNMKLSYFNSISHGFERPTSVVLQSHQILNICGQCHLFRISLLPLNSSQCIPKPDFPLAVFWDDELQS